MKKLIAIVICILFSLTSVYAQEKGEAKKGAPAADKKSEQAKKAPTEAQKKQQERMRHCNANAKAEGKAGDERKKFMSACLKG